MDIEHRQILTADIVGLFVDSSRVIIFGLTEASATRVYVASLDGRHVVEEGDFKNQTLTF